MQAQTHCTLISSTWMTQNIFCQGLSQTLLQEELEEGIHTQLLIFLREIPLLMIKGLTEIHQEIVAGIKWFNEFMHVT